MSIRSKEAWQTLIQHHQASGLSLKAFCVQEGISYDGFTRKRQQLLKQDKPAIKKPSSGFSAVKVASKPMGIEIRYGQAVCYLPSHTPYAYVVSLLKGL